eukprot:UN19002
MFRDDPPMIVFQLVVLLSIPYVGPLSKRQHPLKIATFSRSNSSKKLSNFSCVSISAVFVLYSVNAVSNFRNASSLLVTDFSQSPSTNSDRFTPAKLGINLSVG